MSKELRFDGQVAIVTGAGSGLGRAGAILLAQRGAKVVINCRPVNTVGAEETLEIIKNAGGEATIIPALMGVNEEAEKLVAKTIEKYGRINVIYSNGGRGSSPDAYITKEPSHELDDMIDDHVKGPLMLCRAAWKHMVDQNYGRILFTSSATALGFHNLDKAPEGPYTISKAAAVVMCRNIAMAGMQHNITANIIFPLGYSKMVSGTTDPNSPFVQWIRNNLTAEQVANAALFLMHNNCPAIGESFSVAGGRIARTFFSETLGYFNPELTPEDVEENWNKVMGRLDENGRFIDAVEITQPRDEAMILQYVNSKESPHA